MAAKLRQFVLFAVVGATGFAVDAGTLTLLIAAGLSPLFARLPSFLSAATYTWALNRRVTFRDKGSSLVRQWLHFLAVNSAGGLVNLSVYTFLIWPDGAVTASPVAAAAAGSLSGLVFNFTLSRKFVFKDSAA
ncbi:MAG: GtrA family protein [Rhodomicrobium sp.]